MRAGCAGRARSRAMQDEHEFCAVAHRRASDEGGLPGARRRQRRHAALAVLALAAAACASAAVAANGGRRPRPGELLAWLNAHGDGQLGYSGLRTTVPDEVLWKAPYSATPLAIPGEGVSVAPYPMPYTGWIHRARPLLVAHHPAIRLQQTTTFSDTPAGPIAGAPQLGAPQLQGSPLGVLAGAAGAVAAPVAPVAAATWPGAQAGLATAWTGQPPAYMHPQFLGMVPTTVSNAGYAAGASGAGYVPQLGYMPPAAYSSVGKLQRGFVPVRVAVPSPQLPGLPRLAGPSYVRVGPQVAYDPNNVNSGLVQGWNDVNPKLGLPAIPPLSPLTITATSPGEEQPAHADQNATLSTPAGSNSSSTSDESSGEEAAGSEAESKAPKVTLLSNQAVRVCDTGIVLIDKRKVASGVAPPCIPLSEAKKTLGASGYAAVEELVDAEAVLQEKQDSVVALPEGAHIRG